MIQFADPLALRGGRVAEVGDLADAAARDTVEAVGLFLHATQPLAVDRPASFVLRRGRDAASEAVWRMDGN